MFIKKIFIAKFFQFLKKNKIFSIQNLNNFKPLIFLFIVKKKKYLYLFQVKWVNLNHMNFWLFD